MIPWQEKPEGFFFFFKLNKYWFWRVLVFYNLYVKTQYQHLSSQTSAIQGGWNEASGAAKGTSGVIAIANKSVLHTYTRIHTRKHTHTPLWASGFLIYAHSKNLAMIYIFSFFLSFFFGGWGLWLFSGKDPRYWEVLRHCFYAASQEGCWWGSFSVWFLHN